MFPPFAHSIVIFIFDELTVVFGGLSLLITRLSHTSCAMKATFYSFIPRLSSIPQPRVLLRLIMIICSGHLDQELDVEVSGFCGHFRPQPKMLSSKKMAADSRVSLHSTVGE